MEHTSREATVDVLQQEHYSCPKYQRSILTDLSPYPISDDIKNRANRIYMSMNNATKRARQRKKLVFFCTYNAYKELNIPVTPNELGQMFGLKHRDMQTSISLFSPLQTGYNPISKTISILEYLPNYCEKMMFDEHQTNDVIALAESMMTTHKALTQEVPQTAAAGVIKYYMTINGMEMTNKGLLSQITERSDTTIESMYKKICLL